MKRFWHRLAIPLTVLATVGPSCVLDPSRRLGAEARSGAATEEPRPVAAETSVWQVMHRAARLKSGRLNSQAVSRALDTAVGLWAGEEELPLDALAALAPETQTVLVVGLPGAGPLTDALVARLQLVRERVDMLELGAADGRDAISEGVAAVVVVWRPVWSDEGVETPLSVAETWLEANGLPRPEFVAADLLEAEVDGRAWRADTILIGSPGAVDVAARFILQARATGRVPDAERLAAARGIALDRIAWHRHVMGSRRGGAGAIRAAPGD